jgi:hypothetical protein
MTNTNYFATETEWFNFYKNNLNWYYENYPFLKKFKLPISTDYLKDYYINDRKKLHFEPLPQYLNNYELLFSYFIANYPLSDSQKFSGKSSIEYVLENVPRGITKTFSEIEVKAGEVFGFSKEVIILILIGIALLVAYNLTK